MFSVNVSAQTDMIRVIIGGKTIAERGITANPEPVIVNKKNYKKISDLTIIVKQSAANKIYKRTLQITDENESLLFSVNEQKIKIGMFKINIVKMRQQLLQQETIRVYLAEDPANSMMRIPSKRQLLTELHLR
jgi:transposase